MATKAAKTTKTATRKRAAKKAAPKARPAAAAFAAAMPDFSRLAPSAKLMTPEQAIDLYKSNAKFALDIINAAIEGTARMRKHQFDGEEQARAFGKRAVRDATSAGSPTEFMAAGQEAAQEAVEHAMAYWSQTFELIVEMQKRLFTLMEAQVAGMPGVKETKAALAMMPDVAQMQNVVRAMQGVMTSGGSAFEQMQKMMADFGRYAQRR
ncbi:MAG: TIGR01841 family phasin [Proteobacteria bacterium]|nr:TIGR01841 family phasin [Pseudomonadota bacterium]